MTTPTGAPSSETSKGRYRDTLSLPKTSFPMKANLVQNEAESIRRWDSIGVYRALRAAPAPRGRWLLHDGPPYANAGIHLGHLMNRCMKDFVVRSRGMMGHDAPFVPGWDCHGLPIEHRVMTELMESGKIEKLKTLAPDHQRLAVRRECQKYAEKFVKLQMGEMRRLLTVADYEHPYITSTPEFEAGVLEVLAGLCDQGLVFRALKPVHWSIANETALAEAELEYYDREDPSVYVDFEADDSDAVYDAFGLPRAADDQDEEEPGEGQVRLPKPGVRPLSRPTFMIWTTTPWTLPANLAIAVHDRFEYSLAFIDGNFTVVASDLLSRVAKAGGAEHVVEIARTTGGKLVGLRYRHPFVSSQRREGPPGADATRLYRVVAAPYVTLEDGTGLVHTAPGHGADDFATGTREGLPVYCPVLGDGRYDATAPQWLAGKDIWSANPAIVDHLRASGHLFHHHTFSHSYPHDWRGKTPVILRSTEQWFVGVDRPTRRDGRTLRELALRAVEPDGVRFVPEWGRNRLRGMLESRPDWCISRQRAWGLPIPAFVLPDGSTFMTAQSVRAVAKVIRDKGSDCWWQLPPDQLLAHYNPKDDPEAPDALRSGAVGAAQLKRGADILDVWFESGSSWNAVLRQRSGGGDVPADVYLEGSDQHRGWFQSSLLPSVGVVGQPAFRMILTHGFMVDKDGRKMSKSLGNALNVEDLLKDYGADVCRWWVAQLPYENDVKVDKSFFDVTGESYRKVRNTLRFMLSNLSDFPAPGEPGVDAVLARVDPTSLEAWVLAEFDALIARVVRAYEEYDFRAAHTSLFDFCNDTLSAVYLAAIKDRMYCDRAESPRRRRAQAALWRMTDGLCRLLAPVLCHTADEAYRALHRVDAKDGKVCVHLTRFPGELGVKAAPAWASVFAVLPDASRALEGAKATGIENPLDAGVELAMPASAGGQVDAADVADLLGVSRVWFVAQGGPTVKDLRGEPRCERSWRRDGTVKPRSDGGLLCDRCAEAIGLA